MPPAIIAAGIGAAGAIGGAVLSSSASKKAANTAAQAQQQATDSQLQLGRENINFQQGIYDQNKALLTPLVSRGNAAGNQINSLLGLPQSQASPANSNAMAGGNQWDAYLSANPDVAAESQRVTADHEFNSPEAFAQWHYQNHGQAEGRQLPQAQSNQIVSQEPLPGQSPQDAFSNFANSAGMQFQLKQGTNALNNLYAGRGSLLSGAAMKGIQSYGQNTALNNYFLPYVGLLQGQQATGAQSGAAIAGVGSNFGNTVSSIYGGQQNAIGNGADAQSNAALLKGQANSGLYNTIGSSLGNLASSFIQPSYGGGAYSPYGSRY
jgi:hypothetical protein